MAGDFYSPPDRSSGKNRPICNSVKLHSNSGRRYIKARFDTQILIFAKICGRIFIIYNFKKTAVVA